MAYNHEYPYVDPNRYNSDWLLDKVKELSGEMDTFKALNMITNAGVWDITNQYTAWTIVTNDNIGYISVQAVPAGVDISNTDYWMQIADFQFVIDDLTDRVEALEEEVADLDDELHRRHIILISDSYGEIYDSDGKRFYQIAFEDLHLSSAYWTAVYQGGAGFEAASPQGNRFIDLIQSVSVPDPDVITDVYVWGGANDIGESVSVIKNRIKAFVTYVRNTYPKAFVHIGHPGTSWNVASGGRMRRYKTSLAAYRDCGECGASYIKNSEYILDRSDLMADGDTAHPNNAGIHEMAQQFVQAILTGSCDVHYYTDSNPGLSYNTVHGNYTWSGLGMRYDNGVVTIIPAAGGEVFTIDGGTSSNPISFPAGSAAAPIIDMTVSYMCPDDNAIYNGINVKLQYRDAVSRDIHEGVAVLYPYAYNTTTHHVTYGMAFYTPQEVRSMSGFEKVWAVLPESSYVI